MSDLNEDSHGGPGYGRRPRMQDVATLAEVSLQTVSNFVNDRHGEMSVETRNRVRAAMESLAYRPNAHAASLRSQRVRTIAFLVLDDHSGFLADPLTDQLISGVGDVARELGYAVLIQGAKQGERDPGFFSSLREGRADGAVLQLSGARSLRRRYIDEAVTLGTRIAVVDEVALPPELIGVRAAQQRGARELTDHLLDAGHRRIAFIGARIPWAVVEQRVAGYRASLKARGIRPDPSLLLLEAGYHADGGEKLAVRLLTGKSRPTAIVCASDLLAAGAMHGAKALGLRIPDDVAVAGYDDLQFSAYLDPPLTTVRVPAYEMGRGAAEALISLLEGQQPKDRASVYSTKLVLRQSA